MRLTFLTALLCLTLWGWACRAGRLAPAPSFSPPGCEDRWHDGGPNQSDCTRTPA